MKNMTDIFLQHPGIEAFGLAILHSLWQGALIAAALFIVLQFVKNNANLRYLLACGALLCLLLAFGYTFYLSYTPPVQATNDSSMPAFTASNHIISQAFIPQSAEIDEEKAFSFAHAQAAVVGWIERNSHYIFLLWLAGFLVFSSRLCLGLYYARKLKRNGQQPEAIWIHKLDQFRHTLGIKRAVRLLTSAQVHTPFTLGWIRPVILLPVEMLTQLPCEHIESILLHELAHIRRQDYLINLLQSAAETLLFFNPAYWYMARIIDRERENACDDVAVGIIRQPVNYARALTRVAELSKADGVLSKATVAANRGSLTERIRRIVLASAGQTIQRSEKTKWYLMSIIAIAVLAAVMITAEVRGHQSGKDVETTMNTDPDVDIEEEVVVDLEVDIEEEVDIEIEEEVDVNLDIDIEESMDLDLDVDVDAMEARFDSSSLYNFLHSQWEYIKKRKIAKGEEVPDNVLLSDKTLYIIDGVARDPRTIKPPFDYTIQVPITIMWAASLLFDYYKIEDSYAAFRETYPGDYDNVVILTSKSLKPELNPNEPFTVAGQVFSGRSDMPLSGVKVQLKGENVSTFTNADGRFKIRVPHSKSTLIFSNPDIQPSVTEWIVDDWYRDKKMYVRWRDRKNPLKLPAVKIQRAEDNNDEKAMQEGQVQISSVSNSGNPIFIVDGKPFDDSQISLLNPNDILSIEVLKGEEAKKKYGEKGKNGVILITTKARVEAEKGPLSLMGDPRLEDSRPPIFIIDGIRYTYQELSNFNAGNGKSVTVKSGNSQFQINLDPDDIISMNVQSGGLGITSSGKTPVDEVTITTKSGIHQYAKEPIKPSSTYNFSHDKTLHILDGVKSNHQTIRSSNVVIIAVIRAEDATFYQQKIFEEYLQKYPGDYDYMVVATSRTKNSDKENIHHEKAYDQGYFHTLQSWFDYHNAPSRRALTEKVGIKNMPIPNAYDGRSATQMSIVDGAVRNWWVVKPYEVATVEVYQSSDTFSYFYNVEKGYGQVSTGGNDKLEYLRKIYPGEYDVLLIITTKKKAMDLGPSFQEAMDKATDGMLDTMTLDEIQSYHLTLDQGLNRLQSSIKQFAKEKEMDKPVSTLDFSGDKVLYLLDGVKSNPKSIKYYHVQSIEVIRKDPNASYQDKKSHGYLGIPNASEKFEEYSKKYPGGYDAFVIATSKNKPKMTRETDDLNGKTDNLTVFPNPSENIFTIRLTLSEDAPVQATVIDAAGRRVTSLTDRSLGKGTHELKWDASGQKPGLYRIRIIQNGEISYRNVLVK